MRPRTLALILGVAVMAMLALMGWIAIRIMLAEPGDRTELLAQWRIPMIAMGVAIGIACWVMIFALVRGASAEQRERESSAESAFERQMMAQANFGSAATPAPAPTQENVPQPTSQAPSQTPKPDLEGLLAQLRLAKLDPMVEGEIYAGPQEGAVILRLGQGETALVVRQPPTPEDLATLFPRYDRVFSPLAGGTWLCTERLEGLVKSRMDLSL